ncbi:MAG: BRO family protein [Gammaproteobacteria bacterium]|nr:BRO family protein [Gammaproteobacteria bacterium]
MQNVVPFDFQNHAVRVFSDDPLNPMFVAVDVARALGYAKPENAISRHCRRTSTTPKQGGGFLTLIPESDLYRLTFRSKLQSAEEFTDWVVTQVLPSIRTTGRYEVPRKCLSPSQQRHIQIAVSRLARVPGNSFAAVYRSIKDKFSVGSYKDVREEQYPALCMFLGVPPMPAEVHVGSAGSQKCQHPPSTALPGESRRRAPSAGTRRDVAALEEELQIARSSAAASQKCLQDLRALFSDAMHAIG